MINDYISYSNLLLCPFSTYKYHLVHGRKYNKKYNKHWSFLRSVLLFFSILSFNTVVFIRFGDPSLHSIDLTGVVSWERDAYDLKHIWLCIVYLLPCAIGMFLSKDNAIRPASTQDISTLFLIYFLSLIVIIIIDIWLIFIVLYICLSIIIYLIIIIKSFHIFIITSIIWVIII